MDVNLEPLFNNDGDSDYFYCYYFGNDDWILHRAVFTDYDYISLLLILLLLWVILLFIFISIELAVVLLLVLFIIVYLVYSIDYDDINYLVFSIVRVLAYFDTIAYLYYFPIDDTLLIDLFLLLRHKVNVCMTLLIMIKSFSILFIWLIRLDLMIGFLVWMWNDINLNLNI